MVAPFDLAQDVVSYTIIRPIAPQNTVPSGECGTEGLFRGFDNRRQVAAYAGLAPTPWQSGSVDHEQGVSKAGNPRLRTTMIQLAWLWLRHQPDSALSRWFHDRIKRNGGRLRKTTI